MSVTIKLKEKYRCRKHVKVINKAKGGGGGSGRRSRLRGNRIATTQTRTIRQNGLTYRVTERV